MSEQKYEYEKAYDMMQQLSLEESNWAKYYLDYADNLPRCQVEAIKNRINEIRSEKENLLGIISGAE